MSYQAFHAEADRALAGKFWGTKVRNQDGTLKDTGVQELVETLLQILSDLGPIELDRPLELINKTDGPAIKIYNDGPNVDWMGVRVQDRAGNQAQLGIGLGNEGILANNYIPFPPYWLDPNDAHRFYSNVGENAGGNRYHPRAVEAGNGLGNEPLTGRGPDSNDPGQINYDNSVRGHQWSFPRYAANAWFNVMVSSWQFFDEDEECGGYYRFNLMGDDVIWPTYVPQSEMFIANANAQVERGLSGTVADLNGTVFTVTNPRFGCVEAGDEVVVACLRDDQGYQIIDAPEKLYYSTGTTVQAINKGQTGDVSLNAGPQVTAISPFADIQSRTKVGVIRDTSGEGEKAGGVNGGNCGLWTIIAAECETTEDVSTPTRTTALAPILPASTSPTGSTSTNAATFANGTP